MHCSSPIELRYGPSGKTHGLRVPVTLSSSISSNPQNVGAITLYVFKGVVPAVSWTYCVGHSWPQHHNQKYQGNNICLFKSLIEELCTKSTAGRQGDGATRAQHFRRHNTYTRCLLREKTLWGKGIRVASYKRLVVLVIWSVEAWRQSVGSTWTEWWSHECWWFFKIDFSKRKYALLSTRFAYSPRGIHCIVH